MNATVATELTSAGPLAGMRVLEIGHYVAAPFCSRLLADLGAEVIKIEPPAGDPVRQWGEQVDGHSLWWSVHGRNKKSVCVDLKSAEGREIILSLARQSDAVVENFRPGHLGKLGLSDEDLRAVNPGLVIAHISGYGQTGPYRDRAAFGVIGEAIGGLRHLTNSAPDDRQDPPVRVGVSIGDSIAGLYAAFGVLAALWERDRPHHLAEDARAGHHHPVVGRAGGGRVPGRSLDVALTESVFSMMEAMLPEYGKLGKIKQPTGGAIATAAPSNAYPTADGEWVLIAANSDRLFERLVQLMGSPELAADPSYKGNQARVRSARTLDALISKWTVTLPAEELLAELEGADIPSSKVYTVKDCAHDPQYLARGMVREVDDPLLGRVLHPGVVPHFAGSRETVRWTGPEIGGHTSEVLSGLLGLSHARIEQLREKDIVK